MAKLLHLSCSPRADSESSAGACVFLDGFRQTRPDWDIDVVDLWRERMPEFAGPIVEAKYARMNAQAFNDAQRDSFAEAERMALRFSLADRVLISTPMWNFGIPYKLKQWFDIVIQPGLTFRFDPAQGYLPLLKDRPTIVILASGSDFATGMNRAASTWRRPICARHSASSASATCASCRSDRRPARPSRSAPRATPLTAALPRWRSGFELRSSPQGTLGRDKRSLLPTSSLRYEAT